MWRYLAGGLAMLLLIAAGMVMVRAPARSVSALPQTPAALGGTAPDAAPLPDSVPEATPKTREQKRFNRYDKDRNALITREEYLASRRKAYAKLDVDKDGRLSFDEWAVKTTDKFVAADKDRSGTMTAAEFVATAPKRKAAVRVKCPPAAAGPARDEDEG